MADAVEQVVVLADAACARLLRLPSAFAKCATDTPRRRAIARAAAREPVVEALLRDPFGPPRGVLAHTVPAAWLDAKFKADPQATCLRRQAKARVDHLRMVAGQAEAALSALSVEQRRAAQLAAVMAARAA